MVTKSCMPYGNSFVMLCSISFIIYIDFILIFGEVTINIRDCQEFPLLLFKVIKIFDYLQYYSPAPISTLVQSQS